MHQHSQEIQEFVNKPRTRIEIPDHTDENQAKLNQIKSQNGQDERFSAL